MRPGRLAVWLVILLAIGMPFFAAAWLWWDGRSGVVEVHGRVPEAGGWIPADISVAAGEDLRLRLVSDDVMHGFAIGKSTLPEIDLYPGKPVETTLNFDQPGKYTYYCTRWCGADHWRMRGTIEVTGDSPAQPPAPEPALYMTLGLDIDAPHAAVVLPQASPSAEQGAALGIKLPEKYFSEEYYRMNSPEQAWHDLRREPATRGLDDEQVWDLVAMVWGIKTSPSALDSAGKLYAANCAACHGETGAGDGVYSNLSGSPAAQVDEHAPDSSVHALQEPASFTDAAKMLGASPAVLHGKIVRGGMGTGMPYWGPIFTEEQTWALVNYLYTFQFQNEVNQ